MTDQPAPVPPAFTPNGHGPLTQAAGQIAAAVQALPQALFQAVAAALAQQQVTVRQLPCATCVLERLKWGDRHRAALAAADEAYAAAAAQMAARPPEDQAPVSPLDYLPAELKPGGPQEPPGIADGAVLAAGTLYCPEHVPGAPGRPGARPPLLVAQAGLTPGMLARFR